jgi:D-methionine transport system substrate-binding protein
LIERPKKKSMKTNKRLLLQSCLPRTLDDLDARAINTNYAVQAGLLPTRDAIAIEDAKGPYANLLAVRSEDKDKPWVAKLVKAFQSPEVRGFVDVSLKGALIPAF